MVIKILKSLFRTTFNSLSAALVGLSLILLCSVSLAFVGTVQIPVESSVEADVPKETEMNKCGYNLKASSLLLGSQLAKSQTAQIRYILWMEDTNKNQEVLYALKTLDNGLQWQQESLIDGWGRRAVCFRAEETVNAESEKLAPEKLKQLEQTVYRLNGGQDRLSVYLEESIDEIINLQEYWQKGNISLSQRCNDSVVESWSGLEANGLKPVECGGELINIQLTTRKLTEGGKTVLAFPALYNDI